MALQKPAQKRPSPPIEVVHERRRNNLVVLHWSGVALDDGRPSPVGKEKENNIRGKLTYERKHCTLYM